MESKQKECEHHDELYVLKSRFDAINDDYLKMEKKYKESLDLQKNEFVKELGKLEKENQMFKLNCEKSK